MLPVVATAVPLMLIPGSPRNREIDRPRDRGNPDQWDLCGVIEMQRITIFQSIKLSVFPKLKCPTYCYPGLLRYSGS